MTPGEPVTVIACRVPKLEIPPLSARAGDRFLPEVEGPAGLTTWANVRLFTETGDPMINQDSCPTPPRSPCRTQAPTTSSPTDRTGNWRTRYGSFHAASRGAFHSHPCSEATGNGPDLVVDGLSVTPKSGCLRRDIVRPMELLKCRHRRRHQWIHRSRGDLERRRFPLADRILPAATPPLAAGAAPPGPPTLKLP